MSYFPPLTIDGQAIDLAHLEPLSLAFAVERLEGRTIAIDVKFSNHCYTEAFASDSAQPCLHRDGSGAEKGFRSPAA